MSQAPETRFDGRCHCGGLSIAFTTRTAPAELPLRQCQCSFCRKHGATTTTDPDGFAEIRVRDADALARYRFGLGTADYIVCAQCGVYLAAVMVEAGRAYAVVNVNALDARASFAGAATPTVYDHEDAAARRARRRKVWTPAVLAGLPPQRRAPRAAGSRPALTRDRAKHKTQKTRAAKR